MEIKQSFRISHGDLILLGKETRHGSVARLPDMAALSQTWALPHVSLPLRRNSQRAVEAQRSTAPKSYGVSIALPGATRTMGMSFGGDKQDSIAD